MTQLTTLGLGDNQMHGTIPDSIENLHELRILGLDGNGGLTGSIEKIKKLSNLEALYLESNALTGNLHHTDWPNLKELDLSNNALELDFPVEFFNHPNLDWDKTSKKENKHSFSPFFEGCTLSSHKFFLKTRKKF
jgi:Leucine-rich repeat (LRR) protein